MREYRIIPMSSLFLLVLAVGLGWLVVPAAEAQQATEAQWLSGNMWQTLSRDNKIAYTCGIGNLVELERTNFETQQPQVPADDRKSFIPYLAYGLRGMSIQQVIQQVDAYYMTHPDQRNQPILSAIFQAVVMPRLQEAKAGARSR